MADVLDSEMLRMSGGDHRRPEVKVMDLGGSHYDPSLQMFTAPPREPDLSRLRFLRWLGERGLLEHPPAGAPVGVYTVRLLLSELEVERPAAA
jgi:hypothetical protein